MEEKIKHLEFIQGVINRMAGNSFLLKGWSLTLVSALIALGTKDTRPEFVILALLPAVAFWILDGYFLRQERLFRKLYDKIRLQNGDANFSMDTQEFMRLPCTPKANNDGKVSNILGVCFSLTLICFHGAILLAVILMYIVLKFCA